MDSPNPLQLVSLSWRIIQIISNTEILEANLQLMNFFHFWKEKDVRNALFFNPPVGGKSITLTGRKNHLNLHMANLPVQTPEFMFKVVLWNSNWIIPSA